MIRSAALSSALGVFPQALRRWIGVTVTAGALLAILGPFGSYMNGGPVKLAGYWISAMLLGLVLYGLAYKIVSLSVTPASPRWWAALICAALLASVPEAVATRAGAFWLWPDLAGLGLSFSTWFAQTATIGIACMAAMGFILPRAAPGLREEHISMSPLQPAVTSLGDDVLALQMEDHYVRVHRSTGSELLLMPLGRAIECMEAEGLRTHRSWWVARHAVAAVEGNGRSMRVLLSNGLVAPVARSTVTHLKASGWIPETKEAVVRLGAVPNL
ncbi:MAG TPA: LytTR family DNA-binding domain-containing protein [Sphingomicrobium sp.]|jgi:hypothetical protein